MKGIMFTQPMFNAVIKGRKTQTRRIVKPQPEEIKQGFCDNSICLNYDTFLGKDGKWYLNSYGDKSTQPRYKVGEKLYLKEPYFIDDDRVIYRFDNYKDDHLICKWSNKLFMPEKYARYFIEITDVRVERVQDISVEDCLKEGIIKINITVDGFNREHCTYSFLGERMNYLTTKQAYAALFDSINGKGTWASNPFVFCYSFKLTS